MYSTHSRKHVHIRTHMHIYALTCTHRRMHAGTHAPLLMQAHTGRQAHTCTHARAHSCTHARTHAHTHTHTQVLLKQKVQVKAVVGCVADRDDDVDELRRVQPDVGARGAVGVVWLSAVPGLLQEVQCELTPCAAPVCCSAMCYWTVECFIECFTWMTSLKENSSVQEVIKLFCACKFPTLYQVQYPLCFFSVLFKLFKNYSSAQKK